jgi:hypothetical protein
MTRRQFPEALHGPGTRTDIRTAILVERTLLLGRKLLTAHLGEAKRGQND